MDNSYNVYRSGAHTLRAIIYIFFFQQETAYEMRISDWSSDVCSSDLSFGQPRRDPHPHEGGRALPIILRRITVLEEIAERAFGPHDQPRRGAGREIGRAPCRGRVWKYA